MIHLGGTFDHSTHSAPYIGVVCLKLLSEVRVSNNDQRGPPEKPSKDREAASGQRPDDADVLPLKDNQQGPVPDSLLEDQLRLLGDDILSEAVPERLRRILNGDVSGADPEDQNPSGNGPADS